MKTIYPIMGMMTVALILLLVLSYLIFTIVVPLPELVPGTEGILLTAIVKTAVSAILVLFWIFALWRLTTLYMKRKVYKTT